MRLFNILGCVALAVVVYRSTAPFPVEHQYSFAAKFIVGFVEIADNVGAIMYKFGFSRWGLVRLTFEWFPTPAKPDHLIVEKVDVEDVTTMLVYPSDYMKRSSRQAVVVYLHGGGWVSGTSEFYLPLAYEIIKQLDVMVAIPEYRLAPQHPFPAPFQDCLKVTESFLDFSNRWNADPDRLILMGDSAGGNLATAVSQETSQTVKMLVVIYPLLQMVDFTLPSYQQNVKQPMVNSENVAHAFLTYMGLYDQLHLKNSLLINYHTRNVDKYTKSILGRVNQSDIPEEFLKRERVPRTIPRKRETKMMKPFKKEILELALNHNLAPLMASDETFMRMPTAHVLTCEYDPLRDDGVLLAARLKKLNKDVTLQNIIFGYHGIASINVLYPEEETSREFNKMYENMKRVLSKK